MKVDLLGPNEVLPVIDQGLNGEARVARVPQ